MTFRLQIDLGNAAMQTGGDVAWALQKVREQLVQQDALTQRDCGMILDLNGNVVGRWKITRANG